MFAGAAAISSPTDVPGAITLELEGADPGETGAANNAAIARALAKASAAGGGVVSLCKPGTYAISADNFVVPPATSLYLAPGVYFTLNGARIIPFTLAAFITRPVFNPQPNPISGQVNWASFGDSFSNMCGLAAQDIRQATASLSFTAERMAPWINGFTNGVARPVANCGVSGDTTTQMLARDSAGASSNRRAITDAAALGARFIVNHMGVNDLQALQEGASDTTINNTVQATIDNCRTILKRQLAFGMYPITVSLMGYNYNIVTSGQITVRKIAIARFNTALKAMINGAGGSLGSYVDAYPLVADAFGNWLPGMDDGGGLHPGMNACRIVYPLVADEMMRLSGIASPPYNGYSTFTTLCTNPEFSASTAGVATNYAISVGAGTGTLANSVVDFRGQNWQQTIFTPATFDGNGNAIVVQQWNLDNTTIALNDVIGGEFSVYIDNGSGGAPSLFQFLARLRANTAFSETPFINPTISPKVDMMGPIDLRFAFPPIVSPAATPATFYLIVQVATTKTTPIRVMTSRPRAFKLPTTY